jgi:hypothetical protein
MSEAESAKSGIVAGVGIEMEQAGLSRNNGRGVEWALRGMWKYGS